MKYATPLLAMIASVFMALGVTANTAEAHHSPSSFDMVNVVTVTGTVKEFKWGNPHTWLYVYVPNAQGSVDEWEIEGAPVTMLARHGWKSSSLKPGDKIHVLLGPRRDGKPGGSFMRVTLDNGEILDTGRIELSTQ